ncbi:MAG: hypothetical protein R2941_21885 [Desulfobacterales bacterium]
MFRSRLPEDRNEAVLHIQEGSGVRKKARLTGANKDAPCVAGCQWRMLPVNFCHRNTVCGYFSKRSKDRTRKTLSFLSYRFAFETMLSPAP